MFSSVREAGYTMAWRFDADQVRLKTFVDKTPLLRKDLMTMRALLDVRRTDKETIELYRSASNLYESLQRNLVWEVCQVFLPTVTYR